MPSINFSYKTAIRGIPNQSVVYRLTDEKPDLDALNKMIEGLGAEKLFTKKIKRVEISNDLSFADVFLSRVKLPVRLFIKTQPALIAGDTAYKLEELYL